MRLLIVSESFKNVFKVVISLVNELAKNIHYKNRELYVDRVETQKNDIERLFVINNFFLPSRVLRYKVDKFQNIYQFIIHLQLSRARFLFVENADNFFEPFRFQELIPVFCLYYFVWFEIKSFFEPIFHVIN